MENISLFFLSSLFHLFVAFCLSPSSSSLHTESQHVAVRSQECSVWNKLLLRKHSKYYFSVICLFRARSYIHCKVTYFLKWFVTYRRVWYSINKEKMMINLLVRGNWQVLSQGRWKLYWCNSCASRKNHYNIF